jgi:hypothetical protein
MTCYGKSAFSQPGMDITGIPIPFGVKVSSDQPFSAVWGHVGPKLLPSRNCPFSAVKIIFHLQSMERYHSEIEAGWDGPMWASPPRRLAEVFRVYPSSAE